MAIENKVDYKTKVETSEYLLGMYTNSLSQENLTRQDLKDILSSMATNIRNGDIDVAINKTEFFISLSSHYKEMPDLSRENVIDFINNVKRFI